MQCRSCLNGDSVKFVDMQTTILNGMNLYDYFNQCTQLDATLGDGLPRTLCINCSRDLQTAYNFVQGARETDATLRLILSVRKQIIEAPQKITLIEEAVVPKDQTSFNQLSELAEPTTLDPLGDIDALEEKPNLVELLQKIDNFTEENIKKEHLVQGQCNNMDMDSDDEPLIRSIKRSRSSKDSLVSISGTKSVTDHEYDDESSRKAENNHDTQLDTHNSTSKTVTCQFCQTVLNTKVELRIHLAQTHKSEVTCEKCSKHFNYPNELEIHNDLVHGKDSPVQCRYCPEALPIARTDLVQHFRRKHRHRFTKYFPPLKRHLSETPTPFQCLICKRYCTSAALLADHMNIHTNDKPYKCNLCTMDFNMKRTFQSHLKRKHKVTGSCAAYERDKDIKPENEPKKYYPRARRREFEIPTPFQCQICKYYYSSAALLTDHLHCHADDKPYQCNQCPMRFNMRRTFQAHLKRKHDVSSKIVRAEKKLLEKDDNGLIDCTMCHERLPALSMRRHKARHGRQKNAQKFLCAFCPRLFNDKMVLKSHEYKMHLNGKQITKECSICKKKFAQSYLTTHMEKVHTDERKFACHICGNTFKAQSPLDNHLKLHGERQFECSVCQKKYIRQCDLKVHMRSHTGEQPYACHLCDKRFTVKVRLTYHLQRHAGVKHCCKVCGKEFNHIKVLRQHSYKHTGMPYRCPACGYGCVLRDVFSRHLQRMHAIVMTEEELRAMFKQNTGRMPRMQTFEELSKAGNVN